MLVEFSLKNDFDEEARSLVASILDLAQTSSLSLDWDYVKAIWLSKAFPSEYCELHDLAVIHPVSIISQKFMQDDLSSSSLFGGKMFHCLAESSDFSDMDFGATYLQNNTFFKCDFKKSVFNETEMINDRFVYCDFSHIYSNGSNIRHTTFIQCTFNQIKQHNSRFSKCIFVNCQFDPVTLRNNTLEDNIVVNTTHPGIVLNEVFKPALR